MDVELSKLFLPKFCTLKIFGFAYFTSLTRFVTLYFHPILDKKDPPEDKELPDPSGPLSKVIPSSSIARCNAEVTKVLKQVKRSVTKHHNTKLTPAIVDSHTSL